MKTLQLSSFGEPADVVELTEIPSADPAPASWRSQSRRRPSTRRI
jgi:hypothetical protein